MGAENDFGIIEWIRSAEGGHVHPFQEYRETGIVATQFITKGEILATIPWSHILTTDESEEDPTMDPSFEGSIDCNMVKTISRELDLGKESRYAPIMMFLQDASQRPPMNHLPSNWTLEGRRLMKIIAQDIPPVEPIEWLVHDFYRFCKGKRENATAALLEVQWTHQSVGIVPLVTGMYRHRNGASVNADTTTYIGEKMEIVATRDIQAGENIYISQNLCRECEERHQGYGTAEILRDYGFIESMPQRWHYPDDSLEFEIDYQNSTYSFQWIREWDLEREKAEAFNLMHVRLGKQIRKLLHVQNILYPDNPGVPQAEWDTAWAFQHANVLAMTLAQKALDTMSTHLPDDIMKPFRWHESEILPLLNISHYHSLEWDVDTVDYVEDTCPNGEVLEFAQHRPIEGITSPYQKIHFMIEPETKDVMLELDNVVQITSSYRPYYHEYMIHAAARFVDSVKRVVFVGGGDSMLLHEALKYPDLELVVGLELDQWVVRKSFQYFHTQPHFDDPRVEWWFGDATKSLLLLPENYWGSFDLVLVDLSETVMSLSVTADLNVFDALALLLRPTGVLVKNELYLEEVSKVFDYSMQIAYESPVLCDQFMTVGSHTVDFLHAPLKDHKIPTLLYEPLTSPSNRLELLHDYRKKQEHVCKPSLNPNNPSNKTDEQPVKSAGILEIIDAENIAVPLDETLVGKLERVLVEQGFEVLGTPIKVSDLIWIMMKEGYILARLWPSRQYCSMDVNLWGRFDRLRALRSSLTSVLESPVVSKFCVVVGGMFGSSTWADDRNSIGPPRSKVQECHDTQAAVVEETTTATLLAKDLIVPALEESLEYIVHTTNSIAVAICGPVEEDCLALDVLKTSPKVNMTIRLSACPGLDSNNPQSMYDCEIALSKEWHQKLKASGKTDVVLVDESAPYPMLQIIESLMTIKKYRTLMISQTNVFMAWSTQSEPWRKVFLENYRRHQKVDPIRRAEYGMALDGSSTRFEFGVVASGNRQVAYAFQQVEAKLRERYPPSDHSISVEILQGGTFPWIENWPPKLFYQSDYDTEPGLEQYFAQEPLAHHVVFQLDPQGIDVVSPISANKLGLAFTRAIKALEFSCVHRHDYKEIGEGSLLTCLDPKRGSLVLTWDGRTHVDLSFYSHVGTSHEMILDDLKTIFSSTLTLSVTLLDEMPRGLGRTINRPVDLKSRDEWEQFFATLAVQPSRLDVLAVQNQGGQVQEHKGDQAEDDDDDEEEDDEDDDSDEQNTPAAELKYSKEPEL